MRGSWGDVIVAEHADTIVSAVAARAGFEGALRLTPLNLAAAVVLATISWRLLEKPFLRLKDKFASARHPSAEELSSRAHGAPAAVTATAPA